MCKKNVNISFNVPDLECTEHDYMLVFMLVDCLWREVSNNIPLYHNMLLCDYFAKLGLCVPDYTQFLRICAPDYQLTYKSFGGRIVISYHVKPYIY